MKLVCTSPVRRVIMSVMFITAALSLGRSSLLRRSLRRASGSFRPSLAAKSSSVDATNDPGSLSNGIYDKPASFDGVRVDAPLLGGAENRVNNIKQHRFSVAPMMDYTDCHQRKLQRMISSESVLYTEMVVANALVRTDKRWRFLESDFSIEEPLVLQLGGSDPKQMYDAAKIAHDYGYRQMNINVGCPSEKVAGAGCFGAALMLNPHLVSELAMSIYDATGLPATVKCRIGVDDHDSYEELREFVRIVSEGGKVSHFIVHARKAVLGANFTPDDNRKIPKLKYDFVYSLIKDFPHLYFSINGGILTMADCAEHLSRGCAGVMVGRQVINNPFYWKDVDRALYGVHHDSGSKMNRRQIIEKYCSYASDTEAKQGEKVRRALIKPLFQLFNAETNGKQFRILLDKYVSDGTVGIGDAIFKASLCLSEETLRRV